MSNRYSAEQLLKMAIKKIAVDPGADLDGDNRITSADAHMALRNETGKENAGAHAYRPDETLTGLRGDILDKLMNEPAGSNFDINTDALYRQYRELYSKNASRAAENTYGLASARTGGYGSSYAASAAAAAYDKYMEGLTDRAMEIEDASRKRQEEERSELYRRLNAVNALEQTDYDRYRNGLSLAFDAAKQGDYTLLEELGIDSGALRRGDIADYAALAAKYGDLSFLKAMGIDTSSFSDDATFQRALAAAQYGDYSLLNALGVDTSELQYQSLLKTAAALADYGDYSALELLGVDVSGLKEKDLLQRAVMLAQYGDYSLLGGFSDNLSGLRQKVSVSVQKGAEEAYAYGGYGALVRYLDRQMGYGQLNEESKAQILRVLTGGGR